MAVVKRRARHQYRRVLGGIAATALAVVPLPGSMAAASPTLAGSPVACPPEQYPPITEPRSGPFIPYQIPFTGTLSNGFYTIGKTITASLGPATGRICGYLTLPSEKGLVPRANVTIPNQPLPVNFGVTNIALVIPGVSLVQAYVDVEADLVAQIAPKPAHNGGLDLTLAATFKATFIGGVGVGGVEIPVPLFACTVILGDAGSGGSSGYSAAELAQLKSIEMSHLGKGVAPGSPNDLFDYFKPMEFSTETDSPPGTKNPPSGQPVTGPITNGSVKVVANDTPFPPIFTTLPPGSNGETHPEPVPGTAPNAVAKGCPSTIANLFNTAIPTPAPAGEGLFTADGTFAVNAAATA